MKKKALFSFLLLAAQFPFTAFADVWQDPETMVNYEYTVGEKEASVVKSNVSGSITIRSKFTIDGNEYDVTSIGDRAFQSCRKLTSVTIPESIITIGGNSFYRTNLKSINIPNNVRKIGYLAFGESPIETLTLGDGLISIGAFAFQETNLEEIEIPDHVEMIGSYAFFNNKKLQKVKLGKGIIGIYEYAFGDCGAIEEIISDISHPTDIQNNIFAYECYTNAKLYLPPYMINLYKELKGWKNFVNMIGENFPEDLTIHVSTPGTLRNNVERENMQYTHALKVTGQINGDDILTLREMTGRDMDNKAIPGCLRKLDLSEVDIVDGGGCYYNADGTEIGTHANIFPSRSFRYTKLEDIKLPNSANSVGSYALSRCENLKKIDFGTGISKLEALCFSYSGIEELTIPNQITDINDASFYNMNSLKVVHLNTKLQTFGGILSNINLKEIYAPYQNPPSIRIESPQTKQNVTLYIPKGLSRIYKDHGWYFNTIEEMEDYALPMPFMVTTLWSQNSPYNNLCPGNAAAGCGAIAVAQILNYYQRPAHGFGHVKYGNVDMDFESYPIEWDAIGNIYGETYTTAVARLVAQVGAAMKMQYKTSGSSPVSHASMMWGLQHYLHFSPKSRYHRRLFYSTPEWLEMLNNELEAARPVFYRGDHPYKNGVSYEWAGGTPYTGHMYVIDGRNEDGFYHVNFGHASMSQDKFVNLNIINQSSDSIVDGKNTISYHHRQAMVTDFYPVDGLTDADYEQANIVLTSPIVVNGDATPRTMKLSDKVSVHFSYRPVNFENTVLDIGIGFYNNDNLVAIADGYVKSLQFNDEKNREFSIRFEKPNELSDGNYEICVITRVKGAEQWFKAWDCAPNIIPARIENGVLFLDIPNFHNREASLQLVGEPIFKDNSVEFTLANMSDNNFEGIIRYTYSLPSEYLAKTISNYTSIYENQQVTYRFESPSPEKLTSFDIIYWNGEKNISLLHPETESIREKEISHKNFSGVEIYTIDGVLVKRVARQDVDTTYGTVLGSLPKGVYVVRDKNGTRKYVKRQ